MTYKSLKQLEEDFKVTEEVYLKAKRELEKEKAEEIRKEKGLKYFRQNFKLECIDEDYTVNPEHIYQHMEGRFVANFHEDDKGYNDMLIKELRFDYMKMLKDDINSLMIRVKILEEQLKKLEK